MTLENISLVKKCSHARLCEDLASVLWILWYLCSYRLNGFTEYKSSIKVTESAVYSIFSLQRREKKILNLIYIYIYHGFDDSQH